MEMRQQESEPLGWEAQCEVHVPALKLAHSELLSQSCNIFFFNPDF